MITWFGTKRRIQPTKYSVKAPLNSPGPLKNEANQGHAAGNAFPPPGLAMENRAKKTEVMPPQRE
jgi:hypothetical protein